MANWVTAFNTPSHSPHTHRNPCTTAHAHTVYNLNRMLASAGCHEAGMPRVLVSEESESQEYRSPA